jgi:predicted GIY-YIG superfamily endonuclease
MPPPRRFVYVLKNAASPPRYYTGLTSDVPPRLAQHNEGLSHSTAAGRPWQVDVVIAFADEARATRLERYLKSGSALRLRCATCGKCTPRGPRSPSRFKSFAICFGETPATSSL